MRSLIVARLLDGCNKQSWVQFLNQQVRLITWTNGVKWGSTLFPTNTHSSSWFMLGQFTNHSWQTLTTLKLCMGSGWIICSWQVLIFWIFLEEHSSIKNAYCAYHIPQYIFWTYSPIYLLNTILLGSAFVINKRSNWPKSHAIMQHLKVAFWTLEVMMCNGFGT